MDIILITIGVIILIVVFFSKNKKSENSKEMKKSLNKDLETLENMGNKIEEISNDLDREIKIRKNFKNSEKEFLKEKKIPNINNDRKDYLESLIINASGLLGKENNYKVYFTDFNQNYVSSNSKNYENFKTNWMGIIYTTIKYAYISLGKEEFIRNEMEFIYVLGGILKKIDWLGSSLPLKIIEQYDNKSITEQTSILSKNCFDNKMTEDDKEKVSESLSSLQNFFEETLNQFKK